MPANGPPLNMVTFNVSSATVEDMRKKADVLMYRAKKAGTNNLIHQVISNRSALFE